MKTNNKIQPVVAELARRNLFALVVPTADPHNSEYVAPCFQRRAKLCGFQGSAGTCVVTTDATALLWTDGRYWLEAEQTLDKGWHLMKQGDPDTPTIEDWLMNAAQQHKNKNNTKKNKLSSDSDNDEVNDKNKKSTAASSSPTARARIGIDASTQLWSTWRTFVSAGLDIVPTEGVNVVDAVLNDGGKPSVPPVVKDSVIPLPVEYSGKSVAEKIEQVASLLTTQHKADMTLMTALDDIAWLLNLRCASCCDIPFAPTFFAFAVVTCNGGCYVFVDEEKLRADAKASLEDACSNIVLLPYTALPDWLDRHSKRSVDENEIATAVSSAGTDFLFGKFGGIGLLSETSASFECYRLLTDVAGLRVRGLKAGIVEKLKGVKNATELQGFRESHIRDGVALTRYLAWLHERMNDLRAPGCWDKTKTTKDGAASSAILEVAAANKLLEFRRDTGGDMFLGPSFDTISAAGGNAAIVHYRGDDDKNPTPIRSNDMYLCDSGGQYLDGTTDTTRTVVFSKNPPEHWRRAYTMVLQGHIRINSTVFPQGTTGHALDALARLDLWKHGLNYRHGTGHGVGHCLNVHEGPHGIGTLSRASDPGLAPGNIVSNEPGFYVSNEFGIRIENLEEVAETPVDGQEKYPGFKNSGTVSCKMRSLTMVPLCRALIVKEMLSAEEVAWVDNYHREVFKNLAPLLSAPGKFSDSERAMNFLRYEAAPL